MYLIIFQHFGLKIVSGYGVLIIKIILNKLLWFFDFYMDAC